MTKSVWVVGTGGCGETVIMECLKDLGLKLNHVHDGDGLKHIPYGINSKGNAKFDVVIYLFNNPVNAICSHFRREWGGVQSRKITRRPPQFKARSANEYFRLVDSQKKDLFGVKTHFLSWKGNTSKKPIIFLDTSHLVENIPLLEKFLEVDDLSIIRDNWDPSKSHDYSAYVEAHPKAAQFYKKIYEDMCLFAEKNNAKYA